MNDLMKYLEQFSYGVCTKIGDKLGLPTENIRMFFIYASCFTFGSPLLLYIVLAFVIDFRKYLRRKRSTVWDI
jgi:phage shock protein C